jgi:NADH:ubiquinone oxidoreductase subunit E
MTKVPTRSPTHEDIELGRLAAMGLELEEIADGDEVALPALIELAEDRGRPPSHYVAAIALATELRLAGDTKITLKICAGNCQRYGALDLIDAVLGKVTLVPVSCLDRCDQAPACELHGDHGVLVIAPATASAVEEALSHLSHESHLGPA